MRKAGVAHSKSSKDMESHVFLKAKTRVRPRRLKSPAEQFQEECVADTEPFLLESWRGECLLAALRYSWLHHSTLEPPMCPWKSQDF